MEGIRSIILLHTPLIFLSLVGTLLAREVKTVLLHHIIASSYYRGANGE